MNPEGRCFSIKHTVEGQKAHGSEEECFQTTTNPSSGCSIPHMGEGHLCGILEIFINNML